MREFIACLPAACAPKIEDGVTQKKKTGGLPLSLSLISGICLICGSF